MKYHLGLFTIPFFLFFISHLSFSQSSTFNDAEELAKFIESNPIPVLNFSKILKIDSLRFKEGDTDIELSPSNNYFSISKFENYSIYIDDSTNTDFQISILDTTINYKNLSPPIHISIDFSPTSIKIQSEYEVRNIKDSIVIVPTKVDSITREKIIKDTTFVKDTSIYNAPLDFQKAWNILNAHAAFNENNKTIFNEFDHLFSAYSLNPFLEGFVKKDFGLDNISDELVRINANDRNSIQQSLTDFKEKNYKWEDYLYGDSILNLQKTVSYKDIAENYRTPIIQAKQELSITNDQVHENNRQTNFLDAKTVAVGLSDFIAERAQEELNVTFFNRFRKNLNKESELNILFPNTRNLLTRFEIADYKTILANARLSFTTDLENLGLNFPKVIEMDRYKEIYNSSEVYNIALIYGIANLAYQDKSVEEILLYGFQQLSQRTDRLHRGMNEALAQAILKPKGNLMDRAREAFQENPAIGEKEALGGLVQSVQSYLDAMEKCDSVLNKNYARLVLLRKLQADSIESFEVTYRKRIGAPKIKFNIESDTASNNFLAQGVQNLTSIKDSKGFQNFQYTLKESLEKNILLSYKDSIKEKATDYYQKVIPVNLDGKQYYGYILQNPNIRDYNFFFLRDSLEKYKIIAQGIGNSRNLAEESKRFNQVLEAQYQKLTKYSKNLKLAKINYLTAKKMNQSQPIQVERLIAKKEALTKAIDEEIIFWGNIDQDDTNYNIAALDFLKAILEKDIYLDLFTTVNNSLKKNTTWQTIETKYFNTLNPENFGSNLQIATQTLDSVSLKLDFKIQQLVNNNGKLKISPTIIQQRKSRSAKEVITLNYQMDSLETVLTIQKRAVSDSLNIALTKESKSIKSKRKELIIKRNDFEENSEDYKKIQGQIDSVSALANNLQIKYEGLQTQKYASLEGKVKEQKKLVEDKILNIKTTLTKANIKKDSINLSAIYQLGQNGFYQKYKSLKADESKIDSAEFAPLIEFENNLSDTKKLVDAAKLNADKLQRYLDTLDNDYCGGLVKAQRNAKNLKTGLEFTIHSLFAFRKNISIDTFIQYTDTVLTQVLQNQLDPNSNLILKSETSDELKPTLDSIRLKPMDRKSTEWITSDEFEELKNDPLRWNVFLGLMYQRLKTIENRENYDSEGVALLTTKFLNITNELTKYREELKLKRARNEKITFKDYYPFIRTAVDLFNTTITTRSIGTKTLADEYKSLQMVPKLSNQALSLYENINVKEYGDAILNVVELLKIISEDKIDDKKDQRKIQNGINAILFYGTFIANLTNAETSDQVKTILKNSTLPPGSSQVKRTATSNFSINSYLGPAVGWDRLIEPPSIISNSQKVNFGAALSVPIGFTYSVNPFQKSKSSISLFVPIIDVGAITAFRFGKNSMDNSYSISRTPEFDWENLFSPGAFLIYNLPNSPFSGGIGVQRGPQLRKIEIEGADPEFVNAWRAPMIFFSIDVPFFNLYTGPKKITVSKAKKKKE